MAIGGDIIEITYNHPTLGNGILFAKAGEDSTFDLGGFRSDDDNNSIDGAGNMITKMNRVRWNFEVMISWDMNSKKELETLVKLASDPQDSEFTISHINGVNYGGRGRPIGDLQGNGNAATFTLKLAGGGTLKQI